MVVKQALGNVQPLIELRPEKLHGLGWKGDTQAGLC